MDSLLDGTDLNYVGHRACVRKASAGTRKDQEQGETAILGHINEEVVGRD